MADPLIVTKNLKIERLGVEITARSHIENLSKTSNTNVLPYIILILACIEHLLIYESPR